MSATPYLEYLDKEITLTGVISGFSVAATGLLIQKSIPDKGSDMTLLWSSGQWYLVCAMLLLLVAALLFYRQRSLLAYYHGQISLRITQSEAELIDSGTKQANIKELLDDADSWLTWWWYQAGFVCLSGGLIATVLAVLSMIMPAIAESWLKAILIPLIVVAAATIAYQRWIALGRRDNDKTVSDDRTRFRHMKHSNQPRRAAGTKK